MLSIVWNEQMNQENSDDDIDEFCRVLDDTGQPIASNEGAPNPPLPAQSNPSLDHFGQLWIEAVNFLDGTGDGTYFDKDFAETEDFHCEMFQVTLESTQCFLAAKGEEVECLSELTVEDLHNTSPP